MRYSKTTLPSWPEAVRTQSPTCRVSMPAILVRREKAHHEGSSLLLLPLLIF